MLRGGGQKVVGGICVGEKKKRGERKRRGRTTLRKNMISQVAWPTYFINERIIYVILGTWLGDDGLPANHEYNVELWRWGIEEEYNFRKVIMAGRSFRLTKLSSISQVFLKYFSSISQFILKYFSYNFRKVIMTGRSCRQRWYWGGWQNGGWGLDGAGEGAPERGQNRKNLNFNW